jgi:hypothetical protein
MRVFENRVLGEIWSVRRKDVTRRRGKLRNGVLRFTARIPSAVCRSVISVYRHCRGSCRLRVYNVWMTVELSAFSDTSYICTRLYGVV